MQTDYFTFNAAYAGFRLANNVRGLVGTLCSPKGLSDQFPEMARTILDKKFLDHCSSWFYTILNVDKSDCLPEYLTAAMSRVRAQMEQLAGRPVACLEQPMRDIEAEFIPELLNVVRSCEEGVQRLASRNLDEIELDLRRAVLGLSHDTRRTFNGLVTHIRNAEGLPRRDSPIPVREAEGGRPGPDTATSERTATVNGRKRRRKWNVTRLNEAIGDWIKQHQEELLTVTRDWLAEHFDAGPATVSSTDAWKHIKKLKDQAQAVSERKTVGLEIANEVKSVHLHRQEKLAELAGEQQSDATHDAIPEHI